MRLRDIIVVVEKLRDDIQERPAGFRVIVVGKRLVSVRFMLRALRQIRLPPATCTRREAAREW